MLTTEPKIDPTTSAAVTRIEGSVDPSTGNIDAAGALHVRGNVVDMFQVKSAGDALIDGVIEAAEVTVGGSLHANGGIAGKGRGTCLVQRDAHARYLSSATLECGSDLTVQTEILSSRIIVGGDVKIDGGALVGGHATVAGSLACHHIGSPAGAETIIELGFDEPLRRLAASSLPQIERLGRDAEKIRNALAPLMKIQKSLTSKQKEQVTEMLFEADGLEEQANALREPLEKRWKALTARPDSVVHVAGAIHAGVIVRFRGIESTIVSAIQGPMRLVVRGAGHQKYISLIEDGHQAGHPLASRPHVDPVMENLSRLFHSRG